MLRVAIALTFMFVSFISATSEAQAGGRHHGHGFYDRVYYNDQGDDWGNARWRHDRFRNGNRHNNWQCPKRGRTVYYEESYVVPPPVYYQPPPRVYYPEPQVIYTRPYYPRNNVTLQFGF
jgi:hypothetical protein